MNSNELRRHFLDFFESKGHKIVSSSSLLPNDPSVLFTTAGMQQFSPYLAGRKDAVVDFGSRHLASCQKCFRTDDIEEVGDDTHHTFFEMLGNWSIGQDESGYFKEGAIDYALEFLESIGLDKSRMHITVFSGNDVVPKDEEAINLWKQRGIASIKECDQKDNFWGPVAETGPCGPCSEIHYDRGESFGCGRADCGPNCDYCKRYVEIWNLVFMQYFKNEAGEYELLNQTNIDTGIGFERLLSIIQGKNSAYETDLFSDVISKISNKKDEIAYRIIADHIRGIVFLIDAGIIPSNTGQGYILRRLIRRLIRYGKMLELQKDFWITLVELTINKYKDVYPSIDRKETYEIIKKEEEKFSLTIDRGLKIINLIEKDISGKEAFNIYQSYGFPLEMIKEELGKKNLSLNEKEFQEELKKHQELSRAGVEKKFCGGSNPYLHTATHLLHSALRKVLGDSVQQMGSDINDERLRFDFSFERKLTPEEMKEVEDLINLKIEEGLILKKETMPLDEALSSGALSFFKERYPEKVSVWTIYNKDSGEIFSKEICGGEHIDDISVLESFKIIKEESSSRGVRRIKAICQGKYTI
ncbi:MAG: alanine--tRNA ligase [Candidatus Pacebacteria bacterium]|jgi:alanyl-tRNA synthetase|nr:alanine--tRNA ligase [Candidatus Paceibacterota bacterium]MDD3970249.1 alanine--tRNA ligase [Candidatus Paceibacterota bacterium]MDD4738248.1 alanine--tRNA ligase [Candidatus Paceibacterota bacterium]